MNKLKEEIAEITSKNAPFVSDEEIYSLTADVAVKMLKWYTEQVEAKFYDEKYDKKINFLDGQQLFTYFIENIYGK